MLDFLQMKFSNALSSRKIFHILIQIYLNFVHQGPIDNKPTLFQAMTWPQTGNKPSFKAIADCFHCHICVTRVQEVDNSTEDI